MHLPTNTVFFFSLKGATIKKDEQTGAIVVARIMRGGAADRSGESVHVFGGCGRVMWALCVTFPVYN